MPPPAKGPSVVHDEPNVHAIAGLIEAFREQTASRGAHPIGEFVVMAKDALS